MIRYLTGGESHGKGLTAILEGIPSGLLLKTSDIDRELARRQVGYGRGGRMAIERDRVEFTSGVRFGMTIGSPITMMIRNLDWENWKDVMSPSPFPSPLGGEGGVMGEKGVTRPRPGHADLAGALKYAQKDIRNILERSSARETVARVAVGAVCKRFLDEFGIKLMSWVVEIAGVGINAKCEMQDAKFEKLFEIAEKSDVRSPDKKAEELMKERINEARERGDSVGGVFEVVVTGVPPGLGSHVYWDRRLDGRLAMALMSVPAIKGVEIGMGFGVSKRFGSEVHDEIYYRGQGSLKPETWPLEPRFYRKTNNAGGIEGGISNGEPIVVRAVMKPIPTLLKPLRSVDIRTKRPFKATYERSDVCAVPAASVVGEAVVAFEISRAFMEKFGGDSIEETKRNYRGYLGYLKRF